MPAATKAVLWCAETNWFCCGFTTLGGIVATTAPIIAWANGKPVRVLEAWIRKQPGGRVSVVESSR